MAQDTKAQATDPTQNAPLRVARSETSFLNLPMPHFKTVVFEGPLDLLLHLIRLNQVDIYDIPIAVITEQYLSYVKELEALNLAAVGEYVVMAATLIEIKARTLLPQPPAPPDSEETEDPRAELVARLLDYQQYQGVAETLKVWEELRRRLFFRTATEQTEDYLLPLPEGEANVTQLYRALTRLLAQAGVDEKPVTAVTPRRRLSLRLKMAEILRRVQRAPEGLPFDDLFELPCPRYDIVLSFLALLELLRLGKMRFEQAQTASLICLFPILEEDASLP